MSEVHLQQFFDDGLLGKIEEHLKINAIFLHNVEGILTEMVNNNPEIFRTNVASRVKKIRSIHEKLKKEPGLDLSNVMYFLGNLNDIAGIRLTIATKDLFVDTDKLLKSSLSKIGILSEGDKKCIENTNGYSAVHYDFKSKDETARCEIQVRTLTQDLWAVFSHYESYKNGNIDNKIVEEDLRNYARLMDVADEYATTIRLKKINEANLFQQEKSKSGLGYETAKSDLLTYHKFIELLDKELTEDSTIKRFETLRLCDIFRSLSAHNIYTEADLNDLIGSKTYRDHIHRMIKTMKIEGGSYDEFYVLCKCFKQDRQEMQKKSTFIPIEMRSLIRGLLKNIQTEENVHKKVEELLQSLKLKDKNRHDDISKNIL